MSLYFVKTKQVCFKVQITENLDITLWCQTGSTFVFKKTLYFASWTKLQTKQDMKIDSTRMCVWRKDIIVQHTLRSIMRTMAFSLRSFKWISILCRQNNYINDDVPYYFHFRQQHVNLLAPNLYCDACVRFVWVSLFVVLHFFLCYFIFVFPKRKKTHKHNLFRIFTLIIHTNGEWESQNVV